MESWLLKIQRILLFFRRVTHWIRVYVFGKHTSLHRARFASMDELETLLSKIPLPDSLMLGVRQYTHSFCSVRPTDKRRELGNLLIVGPTRSGKGLLATSQLLAFAGGVVVNDIKGDLFTQTVGYRQQLGPVFVLDPTGVGHSFDPLAGKESEDALISAATHLLYTPDETDGRIFTQRAINMLTQLLLAVKREGYAPLAYVRYMIRSGLTGAVERLNTVSPSLATQFLEVSFSQANLADRFLLSSWGTLSAKLRPLLSETVIRFLSGSDFSPAQLLFADKPVTLYLRWPEQDLLTLSPLVRLLWGTLIDELIMTYDRSGGKGCKPVLMLIDEAGRTAIPALADHATTVVGRGISLWIAIQSLSQLEVNYGKARAQVLRDNMENQLYYRPLDLATAEHLERRLGQFSAYAHSETSRSGTETSEGRSGRPIPLLTAQEIMQLKDEEIIAFHRRLPPFRLNRVDWREQPQLKSRHGLPPPQLSSLPEIPAIAMTGTGNGFVDPDYRN